MITLWQTQLRAQDGQQQNHLIQRGLDHLHGEKSFRPFPGNQPPPKLYPLQCLIEDDLITASCSSNVHQFVPR